MLNRRLIRIKTFKALYAYIYSGDDSREGAVNNLLKSCDMTLELYYFMLNLAIAVTDLARSRIEAGMRKFHPSEQEANPNFRFVNNRLVAILQADPEFGRRCQNHHLMWNEYDIYLNRLYTAISESEPFLNYMASDDDSFESDCAVWKWIFEEFFDGGDEALEEMLAGIVEERSAIVADTLKATCPSAWLDDVEYVINVIIRNIALTEQAARSAAGGAPSCEHLLVKRSFQKPEDRDFARGLLEECIDGYDGYFNIVRDYISNWDSQRLVSTDVILIVMGLAEAFNFTSIPLKVTINEYVDISKYFSTPVSHMFVNGLLDKILKEKAASGEIVKMRPDMMEF